MPRTLVAEGLMRRRLGTSAALDAEEAETDEDEEGEAFADRQQLHRALARMAGSRVLVYIKTYEEMRGTGDVSSA